MSRAKGGGLGALRDDWRARPASARKALSARLMRRPGLTTMAGRDYIRAASAGRARGEVERVLVAA